MAAPGTQIAGFLLDHTLTTVQAYVNTASAKMIQIIAPVGATLLIIYVLLWGAAMAAGQISEPFTDGMKRIIRMALIIAFALTVGVYQGTVANFAFTAPSQVAAQLQGAMPTPTGNICGYTPNPGETPLASMLDSAASEGFCLGSQAWHKASLANMGMYMVAVLTDAGTAVLVAIAAGILFVTYLALAVLLAVGPLFIMFAIFTQTQRFFEAWLGHVLNFMITYLLVACALGIIFAIFDAFLDQIFADYTGPDVLMDCLKLVAMVIAMVMVILQVKHIASALGGGVALGGAGVGGRLASMGRVGVRGSAAGVAALARTRAGQAVGRGVSATARAPLTLARRVFVPANSVRSS